MSAKAEKKEEEVGAEGAKKKKGGKLPIILALVLVLGGGGFFMMKGKSKGKPKEPEIKLGKAEVVLKDEFTVNLADGQTYARLKIGFLPKEGFDGKALEAREAEVSDIVISVLKTTEKDKTLTEAHLKAIKKRIAAKLNEVLQEEKHEEKHEESAADEDGKKSDKKKDDHADEEKKEHKPEEIPKGWDSAKGPILKVFFKAFATQ